MLAEDSDLTGMRLFEIIQEESYPGKLSILRDLLREIRPHYKPKPVYIRMEYPPGEYAQVDWGEIPDPVLWQGHWCQVHAFVMVLCYSRLLYLEFSRSAELATKPGHQADGLPTLPSERAALLRRCAQVLRLQ